MQSGAFYHNEIWPEKVPGDFLMLFEKQYLILKYFERIRILLQQYFTTKDYRKRKTSKSSLSNKEIINREVGTLIFKIL